MGSAIASIVVGVICIMIGIRNTKGDLASIHGYHRKRVTEENKLPFGKLVGSGTIIIGVSIILFGLLLQAAILLENKMFEMIGIIVFVAGLVVGLGMSFYAMIKYNKGIF